MITRHVDDVFGLFPIPFMRSRGVLPAELVAGLVEHFVARATRDNSSSTKLSHTEMLRPTDSPLLREAAGLVAPRLTEFGVHLFGERLQWLLKEMWVNVLDAGGRQAMHNHANSFASGVPLFDADASGFPDGLHEIARRYGLHVPERPCGNDARRVQRGQVDQPGTRPRGHGPVPEDYLMHAVPLNQGERRITLSFNAIPSQLDSWGYVVRLG